jgi:hypothetical protein
MNHTAANDNHHISQTRLVIARVSRNAPSASLDLRPDEAVLRRGASVWPTAQQPNSERSKYGPGSTYSGIWMNHGVFRAWLVGWMMGIPLFGMGYFKLGWMVDSGFWSLSLVSKWYFGWSSEVY